MNNKQVRMRPGLAGDRSSGEIRVRRPRPPKVQLEAIWPTLEIVRKVNCEAPDAEPWEEFLHKFGQENRAKGKAVKLSSMVLTVVHQGEFDEMFSATYDRRFAVDRACRLQKIRRAANGFNLFAREQEQSIHNSVLDISMLAYGLKDLPADASDAEMAAQLAAWTAQDEAAKTDCPTIGSAKRSILWTHASCSVHRFNPSGDHMLNLNLNDNEELFSERKEIDNYFRGERFNASRLDASYYPGITFFRTFRLAGQQMFRMTDYDLPQSIPLMPPQAVVIS